MRTGALRALAGLVLLAALWPAVGRAEEAPSTTLPPDTTVAPDTTLPPPTTEAPPTTVVETPVEPVPEPDPEPEPDEPVAQPEGGPRTLEVTPHNNLVHDQSVLLRGRGWPPHQSGMGAAQCVTGFTDTRGCGPIRFYDVDAAGNFRGQYQVSVILETSVGTFDCRVETCVIGANYVPDASGARFVELSFDPAGPDPTRRTVTVTPDTGLVDGQTVSVTGDGFEVIEPGFGGFANIIQCRAPGTSYADCDPSTETGEQVDLNGHLEADVFLDAVLDFADGTSLDCRTGGCFLSVRDDDEGFASGALVPLTFDPVGPLQPPPTVTVDPDAGLVDGQVLHVSGTGWRPDADVYLLPCRAGGTDLSHCSFEDFVYEDADENGEWATTTTARAILLLDDGSRLDCRVEACVVAAIRGDSLVSAIQTPLGFDPAGPLLQPTLNLARSTGLEDGDVVGVGGQGGRPGSVVQLMQCVASAVDQQGCDRSTIDWASTDGSVIIFESEAADAEAGVHWNGRYRVQRVLHLADGRTVDCALTPCALVVSDYPSFDPSDRAALGFTRSPLDPTVDPSVSPVSASPTFAG